MTEGLVRPNLHVVLIHAPLGLLLIGTFIELFAFLWRRSALRAGGRWMILVGALSLVPASLAGLYALNQANRTPETAFENWQTVRAASPIQGPAWEEMTEHAWWTAGGSVIVLLVVVLWLGASDVWRSRLHLLFLLALLFGVTVIVAGARHGGELVYEHAVGVKMPRVEGGDARQLPLELHVVLAGAVVALALVGIGLSLRAGARRTRYVQPIPDPGNISAALNPNMRSVGYAQAGYSSDASAYPSSSQVEAPREPVARFFLLAGLLALLTIGTGGWTLAAESDIWNARELWEMVLDREGGQINRRTAHVAAGTGIVLMLLFLAVVSRFLAGRRIVLSFFAVLLIALVAAQIWFGSLLMFDLADGPLGSFNGSAAALEASPPRGDVAPETSPVAAPSPATSPTTAPVPVPATTTAPAE